MIDSPRPPGPRERKRLILIAVARPTVTALVLFGVYFVVPLEHVRDLSGALVLAAGGLAVLAVGWWQIRRILAAQYPAVQAIEALTATVSVYLLVFATVYLRMSVADPDCFTEPLSRLDALYFCLTVFSTVGFGDIAAVSEPARAVVSAQMVFNLILLALGIRLLTAAVQWRRRNPRTDDGGR
ncbi:potassium channel family protein [Rhodococcus sp. CH91]|uniref:potassium channel family protein n=1 Tax=Rhodococcus sp. CH91 TaxID=2910256 RepID=UPI001F4B36E9|nr:potassium channel family protein [Rhodococcus sp. CH91]